MGNCSTSISTQVPSNNIQVVNTENHTQKDDALNTQHQTSKLEDFHLGRTLGLGTFGPVTLASYENKLLALKILEKRTVVELALIENILREKSILQTINFPFIVTLVHSFKDNAHLYMGFEFVSGGEMFTYFNQMKTFPEDQARFYAAQIVLVFEYLHHLNIIYRNLKIEEILLAADGYLKLIDFGYAKVVSEKTYTLCGTPEYMSPEIVLGSGHNKSVDYWALGILIYEFTAGFTPFQDEAPMNIYKKILQGTFNIPKHLSPDINDLINNLLQSRPAKRYGNLKNGINDIKNHPWFTSINWDDLFKKYIKPPYVSESDKDHYEKYDEQELIHSEIELYSTEFDGF